jgi:hypothetical protein
MLRGHFQKFRPKVLKKKTFLVWMFEMAKANALKKKTILDFSTFIYLFYFRITSHLGQKFQVLLDIFLCLGSNVEISEKSVFQYRYQICFEWNIFLSNKHLHEIKAELPLDKRNWISRSIPCVKNNIFSYNRTKKIAHW